MNVMAYQSVVQKSDNYKHFSVYFFNWLLQSLSDLGLR
jgi:hypothetical protein